LSGTLFPLGPDEDAKGILEHLGGNISKKLPETPVKWRADLREAFRRLLGLTDLDSKDWRWDVLAFRILISPFYLRRSASSSWKGEWVIQKAAARPVPRIVLPYPDAFTNLSNPKAKGKDFAQTGETLSQKMKRADRKRFLAWTQFYELIHDAFGDSAFTGTHYLRQLENMCGNTSSDSKAVAALQSLSLSSRPMSAREKGL